MAIASQGRVEIIGHIFGCKVSDSPDTVKRQSQYFSGSGHSRGFHLDGN